MLRVPEERFPRRDPAALAGSSSFAAMRRGATAARAWAAFHSKCRILIRWRYCSPSTSRTSCIFTSKSPRRARRSPGRTPSSRPLFPGRIALPPCVTGRVTFTRGSLPLATSTPRAPAPQLFAGFTFADEAAPGAVFAPATVFLPRWQVAASSGRYVAVANVRVAPDAEVAALAARVQAAHAKFSAFPYHSLAAPAKPLPPTEIRETGGAGWFEAAVVEALSRIRAGAYRKIVLARALDLAQFSPFLPLDALNHLRERFPACFGFSLANGRGQSFIGATPERLARVRGRELLTEALAGSAPRGGTATEDARLGRDLLGRAKELHEHQVVVEAIVKRLRELGLSSVTAEHARLLLLPNVQHLCSPVSAMLPDGVHLLDVLASLHPTPAVGGQPRHAAQPDIARLERFDRGLYAGAVGWFDHAGDGEFVVAIRSALMDGARARLFAGAGIVEGSAPAEEKAETDLKLAALLEALR